MTTTPSAWDAQNHFDFPPQNGTGLSYPENDIMLVSWTSAWSQISLILYQGANTSSSISTDVLIDTEPGTGLTLNLTEAKSSGLDNSSAAFQFQLCDADVAGCETFIYSPLFTIAASSGSAQTLSATTASTSSTSTSTSTSSPTSTADSSSSSSNLGVGLGVGLGLGIPLLILLPLLVWYLLRRRRASKKTETFKDEKDKSEKKNPLEPEADGNLLVEKDVAEKGQRPELDAARDPGELHGSEGPKYELETPRYELDASEMHR